MSDRREIIHRHASAQLTSIIWTDPTAKTNTILRAIVRARLIFQIARHLLATFLHNYPFDMDMETKLIVVIS